MNSIGFPKFLINSQQNVHKPYKDKYIEKIENCVIVKMKAIDINAKSMFHIVKLVLDVSHTLIS